jgi:hypothetical protein
MVAALFPAVWEAWRPSSAGPVRARGAVSAALKACRRAGRAVFGRLGGNVMDETQL